MKYNLPINIRIESNIKIDEGDVIKNDFGEIQQVKFGFHQTCLQDFYSSEAFGFYLTDNHLEENALTKSGLSEIEIIGNIYENPELVNE